MIRFLLACLLVVFFALPAWASDCRGGSCDNAPITVATVVIGPSACQGTVVAHHRPLAKLMDTCRENRPVLKLAACVVTAPVRLVGNILPRNRR